MSILATACKTLAIISLLLWGILKKWWDVNSRDELLEMGVVSRDEPIRR